MKLRKNDIVYVTTGKDRGKKGKVLQALPGAGKVVVEGVNMLAKSVRPKRMGEKGQVVRYNAPIDVSKVSIFCTKCSRGVKIGYQIGADGTKVRICRKCKQIV
ncbi:MAG: 50S ribosomal protein L24 [Patescibacteria group bacterium]